MEEELRAEALAELARQAEVAKAANEAYKAAKAEASKPIDKKPEAPKDGEKK